MNGRLAPGVRPASIRKSSIARYPRVDIAPRTDDGNPVSDGGVFVRSNERTMMVIVRLQPGVGAPSAGRFALVGHFGEPTGFSLWCEVEDELPHTPVEDGIAAPFWYVQIEREFAGLLAA